jgi:exosortase
MFFEPSDSSPVVILGLCAWLVWRRRHRLAGLWGAHTEGGVTAALWIAAIAIFTWSVRARAPELEALAIIPALLGAAHLLGGIAALRVIAGPAAVLVFRGSDPAPLLNQILWKLQIGTADFTGVMLRMIGMPVLVSGDRIILREGLFQIIETCSGLRSIETLALLAILMIDLFGPPGPPRRGFAPALTDRRVPDQRAALPRSDLQSARRHREHPQPPGNRDAARRRAPALFRRWAAGAAMAVAGDRREPARNTWRPVESRHARGDRARVQHRAPRDLMASRVFPGDCRREFARGRDRDAFDGWVGADEPNDWMFYGTAGFGQVVHRRYARGAEEVELFIGQAGTNRARNYLTPKAGFPGSGWIVEREEVAQLAGRAATLRVLRKGTVRILAAAWFEASPGLAAESARALLGLDSARRFQRSRIPFAVRLTTPLASAGDRAAEPGRERLERFAERISPALQTLAIPRES